MKKRSVLISGGGPAGLAAALLFDQLGWEDITLVERRSGPEDFEKNKSFNYLIDKRSQRLLDRLGLMHLLPQVGVATREFVATTVKTDGTSETKSVPIIDANRPVCYWTTRRALLAMLYGEIERRASPRVRVLYSHSVAGLERDEASRAQVTVRDAAGVEQLHSPDLVLACDGLGSAIRKSLGAQPESARPDSAGPDSALSAFEMVATPSLSTGLNYKVLNLPSRFTTKSGEAAVDDPSMAYIIPSRHTDQTKACALFAFPVSNPEHPRSVNLIREADHILWTLDTPEALFDYLEDAFPQLAIRDLVSEAEARDFVSMAPGAFPAPQYVPTMHAALGPADDQTHVLLAGDAAHAFPPDLGMGVNAALQDIDALAVQLETCTDLETVAKRWAAEREPEARDLVWLVTNVFPEQYNHRPWALKRWIAGFLLRRGLNAVMPGVFARPGFFLSQDPELTFGQMRGAIERTNGRIKGLGLGALATGVAAAVLTLR
ncbi:MAG: NAD(P)/FAD-dependent oxidoreductase [Pseudomonadota bacterium]